MDLDNKIIICDSVDKFDLINKNDKLHRFKFMQEQEAIESAFFKIEKKALMFVFLNYSFPISISREILSNLYYIKDREYSSSKLNKMREIKKDLEQNGLISFDEAKRRLFFRYDTVFYNMSQSKKRKLLGVELKASFIHADFVRNKPSIYYAQSIEAEYVFIFQQIIKLLGLGVGLEEISIINTSSSDYSILHKLSSLFKVSVSIPPSGDVKNTPWIRDFFGLLRTKSTMKDVINLLVDYEKDIAYDKIISIINDYELMEINPSDTIALFNLLLQEAKYDSIFYKSSISLNNTSAKYCFYANFNEGRAPLLRKDEGYLSSKELEELGLDSIDGYNQLLQEELYNKIATMKNLVITYHLQEDGIKSNPSPLLERLDCLALEAVYEYGLSIQMDKIWLATSVETYQKYGILKEDILQYNLDFLKNRYDNSFKFNDPALYNTFFSNTEKMVLSYTTMKKYNNCPFSYYVEKILGVNDYEQNLGATLGTFVHAILEDCYNEDFSIDKKALELVNSMSTPKEKFYANSMLYAVDQIIKFNFEHEQTASLDMHLTEAKIEQKLSEPFVFVGIMDKVLYQVCGEDVFVAIIDYKTSMNDVLSLDNLEDGLNLQLPTYIHLLSLAEAFKDKKISIIGIYLQHVSNIKYESEDDFKASFRLQGYSISDPCLISKLDANFIKSDYIKSMSYSNNKFGYYSKVLPGNLFANLNKLVEDQIKDICDNIKACTFPVQPIKVLDSKVTPCTYCSYKDICYVKEENFKVVDKKSFKGEE